MMITTDYDTESVIVSGIIKSGTTPLGDTVQNALAYIIEDFLEDTLEYVRGRNRRRPGGCSGGRPGGHPGKTG